MSDRIVPAVRGAVRGHRGGVLAIATVLVVSSVGLATGAQAGLIGNGSGNFTVYADMTDAGALIVGNDVRLHGVKVGTVKSIKVVDNNEARLDLALDGSARPLHKDMTVTVRPVSLLGERYVDITSGTATAPVLADGATVPASQTSRSVDLDEVLDTVNQPTGQALSAALTALGEGVTGQGTNGAKTIAALTPATQQMDQLLKILDQQNSVLTSLVDDAKPVVAGLATDQGAALDKLVSSTGSLLATTTQQQQSLDAALQQLPDTLANARSTLEKLSGVADATTPVLSGLRPTTDNLTQISSELQAFGDAAQPALATLQPVLAKAQGLIDQAKPLVDQLAQSGSAMVADAKDANEFLTTLDDHLSGVLGFIRNWSLTTNGSDSLSHYFRAVITVHKQYAVDQLPPTVQGLVPGSGTAATAGKATGAAGTVAQTVKGTTDNLTKTVQNTVGSTVKTVTGTLGTVLAPTTGSSPDDGSATGLTSTQEGNLLGLLLGDNS